MRKQRKQLQHSRTVEVPIRGRRNTQAAPNSLQFLASIEGVDDFDGRVRGANGIKWRVA